MPVYVIIVLAINERLPEDQEDYFNDIDNAIKTFKDTIEEVFQKVSNKNTEGEDRKKLDEMVQDGIRSIAKSISESKGLGKTIKQGVYFIIVLWADFIESVQIVFSVLLEYINFSGNWKLFGQSENQK